MTRVARRATYGLVWTALLLSTFAACSDKAPGEEVEGAAGSAGDASSDSTGGVPKIVRVQLAASVTGGTGGTSTNAFLTGGVTNGGTAATGGAAVSTTVVPLVSTYCGDGIRDPNKEECDDGTSESGRLCNWACQITDSWVERSSVALTNGQRMARTLGLGAHPISANADTFAVALVEQRLPNEDALVRLNTFDSLGILASTHDVSEGTWPADDADPVVAVLPNGDVLTAFTELGGDGDGLGIALRRLRAGQTQMDPVVYVSEPSFAAQQHADLLALPDGLVVGYTDESNGSTGPELRVREFDFDLKARSSRTLTNGEAVNGRLSLSTLGTKWGAAWRSLSSSNNEIVHVYDASKNVSWIVGPHNAGPSSEQPALIELDEFHRLVVYGVGVAPDGDGIYSLGRFNYAVLDTRTPNTPIARGDLLRNSAYQPFSIPGEARPSLVKVGNEAYLAWQTGAVASDTNAEDTWFRRVSASNNGTEYVIAFDTETRLPRWDAGRLGDQRNPSLALLGPSSKYPSSALVSVWDDYGETTGAGSGEPEVLLQLAPLPLRRDSVAAKDCSTAQLCASGTGRCTNNNQCQSGLICSTVIGPNFDFAPGVGVCAAPNCVVNNKPVCNVSGCGTCACGDGVVASALGEICDDAGNSSNCDSDCTPRICGDGYTNDAAGEVCDPGTVGGSTADCESDCTAQFCGDGIVNIFVEYCDSGTPGMDTAYCTQECTISYCGDNYENHVAGESCDPGAFETNTSTCNWNCTSVICGDNIVNDAAGETCDPGTVGLNTATCTKNCTVSTCGDTIVNTAAGEECDLGTAGNIGVDCTSNCKLPPFYAPTGVFVVEGDMVLPTRFDLNTYFTGNVTQGASDAFRNNGIAQRWNATDRIALTYCVLSSGFGSDFSNVLSAIAQAAAYWEQVAGVHFDYVPDADWNCSNASNTFFNVKADNTMAYNALSFFPEYGRGHRQLILNLSRLEFLGGKSLTGVLVHELGHILGFTHDHLNCDSAMVPLPGTSSSCPSANSTDYSISTRDVWNAAILYGSATPRPLGMLGNSSGRTFGDWDVWHHTATATRGFAVIGVSQTLSDVATDKLLTYPGLPGEFSGNETAILVHGNGDVRRDNRIDDWAWGFYKFECGASEYLSGMSQVAGSPYRAHAFRCSSTNVPGGFRESCDVETVPEGLNRGMLYSGDWDFMRYKAACQPGKVIVGASVYTDWDGDEARRGRIRSVLCCGSSSRPAAAYNFEQRDAGFIEPTNAWDGVSYYKARCAPGYGMTGVSLYANGSASSTALCSASTNGQYLEGSSVVLVNNAGDQRRATHNGDWDAGWDILECGANEYITGLSQSSTTTGQLHAVRCTTGNLTNQGLNNCETRLFSTSGDDRGNYATGDWSPTRHKLECSAGKVMVGISSQSKPHRILCCDR